MTVTKNHLYMLPNYKFLLFNLILLINSLFAHMESWNKIEIEIDQNALHLNFSLVQEDILGEVDTLKSRYDSRTTTEWNNLLPKIISYMQKNMLVKINDAKYDDGNISTLNLVKTDDLNDEYKDSAMLFLALRYTIPFRGKVEMVEGSFDFFESADIPVNWIIKISTKNNNKQNPSLIIENNNSFFFDVNKHSFVDLSGKVLKNSNFETKTGKLIQKIKIGFSQMGLQEFFNSAKTTRSIIFYFLLAIIIGAFHALSPGHGKALIGAYIIGTRGTVRDAIILGVVTAISHTSSVLILGVVVMFIFGSTVPDQVALYLNIVSGVIILIIGIFIFTKRIKNDGHDHSHNDHDHSHNNDAHSHHDHSHNNDAHSHHDHSHHDDAHSHHVQHSNDNKTIAHKHGSHEHVSMETIQKNGIWTSVMMGVSGGIVPCPTALVILFLAISLQKLKLGLMLILLFSFGLALSLTILGIVFSKGAKFVNRYDQSKIIARLPIISAFIIIVIGVAIIAKSLIIIY